MLKNLKAIQQFLLRLATNSCLKMYNNISKKVKSLLNIKFDTEPVYGDNDKYIKAKIKIHDGTVNTNVQGKKYRKKKRHAIVYQ